MLQCSSPDHALPYWGRVRAFHFTRPKYESCGRDRSILAVHRVPFPGLMILVKPKSEWRVGLEMADR